VASLPLWVFWALFGIAAMVLILWMVKKERARLDTHLERCKAAAEAMGASYEQRASERLLTKVRGFDLTYADGVMLPERIRDVFGRARPEGEAYVFLHEHRSGRPEGGGATQRATAGCVLSPRLRLPRFRLCPERKIERLASAVGMRDVDFDTHAGFSASYFLNTRDEADIRALFGRRVLDFFENNPGLYVEGNAETLLIYRPSQVLELKELPRFFGTIEEIARLLEQPSRTGQPQPVPS
jgi:hypothetical protein